MSTEISSSDGTLRCGIVGGLRPGNTAYKITMGGLRNVLALALDPRRVTIVLLEDYSEPILSAAVRAARERGWNLEITRKADLTDDEATACFVRGCDCFAFIGDDLRPTTSRLIQDIETSGRNLARV